MVDVLSATASASTRRPVLQIATPDTRPATAVGERTVGGHSRRVAAQFVSD